MGVGGGGGGLRVGGEVVEDEEALGAGSGARLFAATSAVLITSAFGLSTVGGDEIVGVSSTVEGVASELVGERLVFSSSEAKRCGKVV